MNWVKIFAFACCVGGTFFVAIPFINIVCAIMGICLLLNFIFWIIKSIFKGVFNTGRKLDNNLRKSDFTLFPGLKKKREEKQKEELKQKIDLYGWNVKNDN